MYPNNKAVSRNRIPTSHVFHLIMTVCTAGFWLPVWFFMAVVNPMRRRKTVTRW